MKAKQFFVKFVPLCMLLACGTDGTTGGDSGGSSSGSGGSSSGQVASGGSSGNATASGSGSGSGSGSTSSSSSGEVSTSTSSASSGSGSGGSGSTSSSTGGNATVRVEMSQADAARSMAFTVTADGQAQQVTPSQAGEWQLNSGTCTVMFSPVAGEERVRAGRFGATYHPHVGQPVCSNKHAVVCDPARYLADNTCNDDSATCAVVETYNFSPPINVDGQVWGDESGSYTLIVREIPDSALSPEDNLPCNRYGRYVVKKCHETWDGTNPNSALCGVLAQFSDEGNGLIGHGWCGDPNIPGTRYTWDETGQQMVIENVTVSPPVVIGVMTQ